MSQILYRRIDQGLNPVTGLPNYEPVFGGGQSNFVADIYAVAQAVMTRLKLFQGEWWENLNDGLSLFQKILGQTAQQAFIDLLISQRITGTPFVTGVIDLQSSYSGPTRGYTFYCVVQTIFGPLSISSAVNIPTPPQQGITP